jgi:hypothetical protein
MTEERRFFKDDFTPVIDRAEHVREMYKQMLEGRTIKEVMVEQNDDVTVSIHMLLDDGSRASLSKGDFFYQGAVNYGTETRCNE